MTVSGPVAGPHSQHDCAIGHGGMNFLNGRRHRSIGSKGWPKVNENGGLVHESTVANGVPHSNHVRDLTSRRGQRI